MPTSLPSNPQGEFPRAHKRAVAASVDWVKTWAISLALCAIVLAAFVYFMGRDNVGASFLLAGAVGTIEVIGRASAR